MRSVVNDKLVSRNARIGQYTSMGSLVILGIGLLITFRMPDKLAYSLGALLIGFLLSQVGMYYSNRWGRTPRPHETIDKSLKGLGREYIVYHYVTPVSHLLVSPAGIWALLPFYQNGSITYEKNRWRSKGGGFAQSYLRLFGQENIGRPDIEAGAEVEAAKRYFKRLLPESTAIPEINAVLLFVHPKVELHPENSPLPAMLPKDLKDFLRNKSKLKPINSTTLEMIQAALPGQSKEQDSADQ